MQHVVTKTVAASEGQVQQAVTYTASSTTGLDESIASNATNYLINIAIDVSEIESIYIYADQDLTIKTNSSGAPDNTINLNGGTPFEWQSDSYYTNLLTTDITKIYVTNASSPATATTLYLRVLQDATP